jgi:hypothetical protein
VLNATNKDAVGNAVVLEADKLVDLNITAAADFTVGDTSKLAALESLTVATAGAFTANGDLAAINSVNLSGTGTATLGNLGATDLGYGISVVASTKQLTIADIDVGAGQSINLNVANVAGAVTLTNGATVAQDAGKETGSITVNANGTQGDVDLGDLQAKSVTVNAAGALGTVDVAVTAETATVTGSELKANTIDVTASKSATVTGGIAADVITVIGNADAGAKAIFTLTGGLGADDFVITTGSGATVVTITDFALGSDDVTVDDLGADNADKLDLSAFGFTGDQATIFTKGAGVTVAGTGANATFTITDTQAKDFFANSGVDKGVALVTSTTETFVFIDADKNGDWNAATDSVVLLVGDYSSATGDALIAGQFIFA